MSWTIKVEPSDLHSVLFPLDRWTWMILENGQLPYHGRVMGTARSKAKAFEKAERQIEKILFERTLSVEVETRQYVPRRERDAQEGS